MRHFVLAIFIAVATGAWAQHNGQQHRGGRFNPQEFKQRMEAVVKERAGFTDEEAAKFFPLFHELHEKQRKLNFEAGKLKAETDDNASDEAARNAVKRITAIKVEAAQLEQDYYNRLCQSVSAAKVLRAMKAEDQFNRDMLKRMSQRRNGAPGRK